MFHTVFQPRSSVRTKTKWGLVVLPAMAITPEFAKIERTNQKFIADAQTNALLTVEGNG